MPVSDDQNSGVNILSCGGIGCSAIPQFFFLILLVLTGSIILMTNPVMAEQNDRNVRNVLSNLNKDLKYNYISRALERLHFGPLLRLRNVRLASDLPKSKQKKALSYLSRFYLPLQYHHGNSQPIKNSLSLSSSRRRTSEIPVGRFTRPIMRLRWGK